MTTTLPHDHDGADVPPDDLAPPGDRTVPDDGPWDEPGSGPEPDPALGEAAARLRAWRATRAGTGERPARDDGGRGRSLDAAPWPAVAAAREPGEAAGTVPGAVPDAAPRPVQPDEDELAARLRARRSARHVAAAYAAAHGHPLGAHDDAGGPRRWSIGLRTAVVASVVVLVVAVVVAVVATARPDDVITLAGASAPSAAPSGSAAPTAAPSSAPESGAPAGAEGSAESSASADPPPGTVVVHVVGEVREPGLVTVPSGARVADAVAAAGGTTRRADAAALNLARAVVDGEQIRVPRPGEQLPSADGAAGPGGAEGAAGPGAGGAGTAPGTAVNLNSAGAADLEELPGIGPALAERIIAWRDENGPFTSVDELDEVSGIGPSVLGQVRDLVTL
ncbi:ComEA family DNA-binding protein [Isoptericola sp. F-RaC21]|uniref:ComEA family DNA-binding protein n=1 Tax=Isoptericola sp. F-RaC21 TaxID=3141452 RepID=UPI00315C2FA4